MASRRVIAAWSPLLLASSLLAQYTTATLSGNILDASGAPIPAARVAIRNIATGFAQTTQSSDDGSFLFPRLPVGDYELTADKPGFSSYLQTGITLTVNQQPTHNITLKVGQVSEKITVEATAELVDTRTGTVGQLVDREKIVELPFTGRLAQRLVFLAPGTVHLGPNRCRICGHGGVYPHKQTARSEKHPSDLHSPHHLLCR